MNKKVSKKASYVLILALSIIAFADVYHIDVSACEVGTISEIRGDNVTGGSPMHRLYNPNSGEHFYTSSNEEIYNLVTAGWNYEGVGFIASDGGDAIYRLYNRSAGDHHYTVSADERDSLIDAGWEYEGISWYSKRSGDSCEREVYRLYNPQATTATHHYTLSEAERDYLISIGWRGEGTSWISMHSVRMENFASPTCVNTGYSGDARCDLCNTVYMGFGLPINPAGHARINHWNYMMNEYGMMEYDHYICEGCLAEIVDGVWVTDQEFLRAYRQYQSNLLRMIHYQIYGWG